MTSPISDQLRALAGPELYRRNAFRLTGLPTDATGRATWERRQKVLTALDAGVVLPDLPADITLDEARAAFYELADPRRRIVHEVLWAWGPDNARCGCPSTLHADHDQAVSAHEQALDAELDGEDTEIADALWLAAAELWSRTSRRAAFWDHLRHRAKELDDRRLDESIIDALREGVPRTLVAPIVALAAEAPDPARLVEHARRWKVDARVVDDLLLARADPALRRAEDTLARARRRLDADAPRDAAEQVETVVPELNRLKSLLPEERRVSTLRDQAGLVLNNCALELMDQPAVADTVRRWFDLALELTTDPEGRRTIETNRSGMDRQAELARALAPYGVRPKDAFTRVVSLLEQYRTGEAMRLLLVLRQHCDPSQRAEIDKILATLARKGYHPSPAPLGAEQTPSWRTVAIRGVLLAVAPVVAWAAFSAAAGAVVTVIWVVVVLVMVVATWRHERRW